MDKSGPSPRSRQALQLPAVQLPWLSAADSDLCSLCISDLCLTLFVTLQLVRVWAIVRNWNKLLEIPVFQIHLLLAMRRFARGLSAFDFAGKKQGPYGKFILIWIFLASLSSNAVVIVFKVWLSTLAQHSSSQFSGFKVWFMPVLALNMGFLARASLSDLILPKAQLIWACLPLLWFCGDQLRVWLTGLHNG